MSSRHHDEPPSIYDRGLQFDLATLIGRRQAIRLFGYAGLFGLVACAGPTTATTLAGTSGTTASDTTGSTGTATTSDTCELVPEETAGPFPGDGSNGPNILDDAGVVRRDIRASIGDASGVAEGVPLTIELTIQDTANGCSPLVGAAVYLWHCDREGNYSMYSPATANENYLRGVQATDETGTATFESVYPGCYQGRWPHIHFEVYPDTDAATSSQSIIATSQIAFPQDTSEAVYATEGYERSVDNLAQLSLKTDNVFRDGWELQLGEVSGDTGAGMTVRLTIAV